MVNGWRINTINGLLLASFFLPTWCIAAFRIVIYPMRGIYERANIGPIMYVSDMLQLSMLGTMRFAWLLAVAKLVVSGFFLLFAVLTFRVREPNHSAGDEALGLAVTLGCVISIGSMMAASLVGEAEAVRLHATESLMLLGGLALLAIDSQSYGVVREARVIGSEPDLVPAAAA